MAEPTPLIIPEVRPIPDPTDRTMEHVHREFQMLREIIEQRLDGYDKAITLIQTAVDREPKPPVLEANVEHLRELTQTMFSNIDTRFNDRDKRNEHMIRDSKALVDNTIVAMREAFAEQNKAQQAAVGKSEAATNKQMEQMNSQFQTEIKSLGSSIADIKDRITSVESRSVGKSETKEDLRAVWAMAIGAIAVLVSIISVVYTVNRPAPVVQVVPASPPPAPPGQITQ